MQKEPKSIVLQGVNQNNLKNITAKIPLGSFTVICGPSGSGKSSLAFETLYAEGQRRYVESLSSYARQFLNKAPKPNVDFVQNIPPAIAIEQKNYVKNSRSTVGTTTEIIDYMRLLFAKIGEPVCPNCHAVIKKDSVSDGTERLLSEIPGARAMIMFPICQNYKIAEGKKLLALLLKEGFLRITQYTKPVSPGKKEAKKTELPELIDLEPTTKLPDEDFFVVLDRLAISEENRGRIADSISQAYAMSIKFNQGMGGGSCRVRTTDGLEIPLSEENSCSFCGFTTPPLTSQLFSFSSPYGACPSCNGFGNILKVDINKVIPNPALSIAQGCVDPFTMPSARKAQKKLMDSAKAQKIDVHRPWQELDQEDRDKLWNGDKKNWGILDYFEELEEKKYKMHVRVFLSRVKSPEECPSCHGSRLRSEALNVYIGKRTIGELSKLPLGELRVFFDSLKISKMEEDIASEILKQIRARLSFLIEVGVDYLTLDRLTKTLSGGEYQRINLANQLGMGLSQTLYVLDEPTVGLHPRDNERLIGILKKLRSVGNTLVVVEHDQDVIQESSHVIEMGPGSGHLGGQVIYSGLTSNFDESTDSITAPYLRPKKKADFIVPRRSVKIDQHMYKIELKGCTGHNLKNINVAIPLNRLVCITGVSGSGKSTLVVDTLYPALARQLQIEFEKAEPFDSLNGAEHIKNVMLIDQKPIGKSSRSIPLTYLKMYDDIRALMASSAEARIKGFTPAYFSFNVDGGRCPACKGEGVETIDMVFMEEITLKCEICDGKRFKKEILECYYQGKNINDILNMTVAEAIDFFLLHPHLRRPLYLLREVGLDYLRLGQAAPTLSGGESQRLKIAKEFQSAINRQTLYILDEPTTGLHFREVEMLLKVINRLIDNGGSVIVIEHNMDVIRHADYIIDLGPEGGAGGGGIVAAGTPEDVAKVPTSQTGRFLKKMLRP